MKIAVFGDSFAAHWPTETPENPSWVSILQREGYTIDNYAECGSSLYWSWKQLNKTDLTRYQRVVFIVTHYDRYSIPMEGFNPNDTPKYLHVSGMKQLERMIAIGNFKEQQICEVLKEFAIYINIDEQKKDMQKLMLENIKGSHPDILLIPAFHPEQSCVDFQPDLYNWGDYEDESVNHLPLGHRLRLAEAVKVWFETGKFKLE